jgi:hypothetical protein
MPTKSPEPAKHDAPIRIQAQSFSSHGNFRARNFDRLRVSQPSWPIQTRQIYTLVLHPFPPYRRGNWLGHVPLFTLIIGYWDGRNRATTCVCVRTCCTCAWQGTVRSNNNHPPSEKVAVKNIQPPTDLANATPQHRQIDRIFQRMLLSLHTPR